MHSSNLVKLALAELGCSQKELALRLGVSPAQVSKWKGGEYMSNEMEGKLKEFAGIGDRDPDLVALVGGPEQADKWVTLVKYLAEFADEECETGYITEPLHEDGMYLTVSVLHTLKTNGIQIPLDFPGDIDFDYESSDDAEFEHLLRGNPISKLIYESFKSLTDVYGFYTAYIEEVLDEMDDDTLVQNELEFMSSRLYELALVKTEGAQDSLRNFNHFKYETLQTFKEWVLILKTYAVNKGIPLRAEFMDLISEDIDNLSLQAESQSSGFNDNRIHPDIYMDEILKSLRLIHQVLPKICEKLDIDLKIDSSNLSLKI